MTDWREIVAVLFDPPITEYSRECLMCGARWVTPSNRTRVTFGEWFGEILAVDRLWETHMEEGHGVAHRC